MTLKELFDVYLAAGPQARAKLLEYRAAFPDFAWFIDGLLAMLDQEGGPDKLAALGPVFFSELAAFGRSLKGPVTPDSGDLV